MSGTAAPSEVLKGLTVNHLMAIAPMVAEHLEVRGAMDVLKASVAVYMTEVRGLSVSESASHVGMSERWIYSQLKRYRGRAGLSAVQRPIRQLILNFILDQSPRAVTLRECVEHLESRNAATSSSKLVNLIAVFCNLGYIEQDGHLYRWKQGVLWYDADLLTDRAKRVSDALPIMVTLLKRYVQENNGVFRHLHVRVTPEAYAEMVTKLTLATRQAVAEAIQKSSEANPDGFHPDDVLVEGLIILGSAPANPPKET